MPMIGKTNTDEFAMGSSTENSAYGPSRNPWDPTRVPGGSGGGTAAAVSGGLAPWGLGSDTGGSIKQPSALCGNVGLRPTYGTVSRFGIVAFASSLDQIGPVGEDRARRGAALLDHRRTRRERLDHGRVARGRRAADDGEPRRRADRGSEAGVRTSRASSPASARRSRPPIETARSLGAEIGECDLPLSFDYGMACYYLIAPAEASSNLARYDGVRYGPRVDAPTYREMVEQTRDAGFGDEPKRRIMLGTYALSAGYYDAYYGQAQRVRTLLIREHRAALEQFDVIATPTSPTVAFPIGDRAADPLAMYACDVMTIPSCLAGLPGLNIPSGLSEGLPVGLQLIGSPVRRERALPGRARARAGDRLRHGAGAAPMSTTWETVVGLEIHVQLKTRTKMFCRCAAGLRGGGEHPDLPRLPRLPRRAARDEPDGDRVDGEARARARLRDRAARRLRPQELLLPRSAEGLSDLAIRYAFLRKWQHDSSHAGGRADGRDRARPPRGGRGEDRAHGRALGPDRRRRVLARRLQPRRHAAARDRHRARHPLLRGGEAVPAPAAADRRRARHLGRGDGEGHAARRRQRLGASGGLRRAPHAVRDQEHELVQLHRPRHRGRGGPADRDLGGRRTR